MFLIQTYAYFFLAAVSVTKILGHTTTYDDHDKTYQNLYGFEQFDTTSPDPGLLDGLISFLKKSDQFKNRAQPDVTPLDHSEYDFIVVGAGSAGCAVASRLSEVAEAKVLLIEAGGEEGLYMDIPFLPTILQHDEDVNWAYKTEPSENYCRGMENHECKWPRGKVMGGSSVLNYMVATRGCKKDFDRWAELGNSDWSYDKVLKYFKKLENMLIPELASDTQYHGNDGPITISYSPFHTPLADAFLEAGVESGYPIVDYNGKDVIGFARVQSTTVNGTRMSSNRAYLHGKFRNNLHVTKRSLATRIIIDPKTKRAEGVVYIKNNKTYTVYAEKEVILSAGTIGSAQLLMLSGVGPAADLEKLGIPVIKDLPVGENLQDHVGYPAVVYTVEEPISLQVAELVRPGTPYIKDYLKKQTGPFSVIGGCDCLAFMDVFDPLNVNATPNIELVFLATTIIADPVTKVNVGYQSEIYELFSPLLAKHTWSTLTMLLKPKSRGWLKLRSSNIEDKPIINPNYFDHPDDVRTLIGGINFTLALGKTKAMQKLKSTLFDFELKECAEHKGNFDKYYECAVRLLAMTIYHHCGTCKMGLETDSTAVVTPELRVIGIDGLRVVDASIIPEITSFHTNLPVYMIAEKAADMIKMHWSFV